MLKELPKADLVGLLGLVGKSLKCKDEQGFRGLTRQLSSLTPFDFAICGLARKKMDNTLESYEVLNVSYPPEWLELYIAKGYHQVDPIVRKNFSDFSLQYWGETYKAHRPPREFLSSAEDFGLKNGYTLGVRNLCGKQGSLFSLSGNSIERHPRTELVLQNVIPHFHQALSRILKPESQADRRSKPLSAREKEVLQWLKCGKSSWDISVIMGISERTVNYHIYNILGKLDAVNRTQAVAVAMEEGLIGID